MGGGITVCIAGGIPACLAAGGVLSQHALQQGGACSGGSAPGGGGLLWGVPAPGGCLLWGVCFQRGCGDPPPHKNRRLLFRTVRILLECILVRNNAFFISDLLVIKTISVYPTSGGSSGGRGCQAIIWQRFCRIWT